jgi:hypothetical protein
VVGWLAFSQIVTLYVTPVFYTYLDGAQTRVRRVLRRAGLLTAPPTPQELAPTAAD